MSNKKKQKINITLSQNVSVSANESTLLMNKKQILELSNQDEVYYLQPESILYVQASGNYCDIHLTDGDVLETVSCQRAEVARRIESQLSHSIAQHFCLVGKPYLVNVEHIMHINASKQQLMFDVNEPGSCRKQCVKASPDALRNLRRNMEQPAEEMPTVHNSGLINGGFANYRETELARQRNYELDDDEVMMLGR